MTERRNLAASVRQRLTNRARERGDDVELVFIRYALERLLYRLGRSDQRDRFILKGAMLFALWSAEPYRATRDLDLLGLPGRVEYYRPGMNISYMPGCPAPCHGNFATPASPSGNVT